VDALAIAAVGREDGPVATSFRLRIGDVGPVQQSPVTCGSACLTVARMLVDPVFARWITTGEGSRLEAPPGATKEDRFAGYERIVMARTNGFRAGSGRLNAPWPHALGTPPWGAKKELEYGASRLGTAYEVEVVREERSARLRSRFDHLIDVVADGEPALLYIGNAWMPRHVTLVLPEDEERRLAVYDPASGRVSRLERDAFTGGRLRLSGWDRAWIVVQPTGARRVRATEARTSTAASNPVRATSAGAFSRNGSSAGSAP
jgi:hypothetical protein